MARKRKTVEEAATLERLLGLAFQAPTPGQAGAALAWAASRRDWAAVAVCVSALALAASARAALGCRRAGR